jgi:o-succinylbenzoate synthase
VTLAFAHYQRKLRTPFVYGSRSLWQREGIVLRRSQPGTEYYSEASPLPGHSTELLAEVLRFLSSPAPLAKNPTGAFSTPFPSLNFGLEALSVQDSFDFSHSKPVAANALVPAGPPEKMRELIQGQAERGFRTFKLKVHPGRAQELLPLLRWCGEKNFVIRLDANQSMEEQELGIFFANLKRQGTSGLEYMEEPTSSWSSPVLRESPLPLAADESAGDGGKILSLLSGPSAPAVFILKPTVLGGGRVTDEYRKKIAAAGKKSVVTTALEAEPGRRALLAYLLSRGTENAAGVCTGFLFAENFLPDLPLYSALPEIGPEERAWLGALNWKEIV